MSAFHCYLVAFIELRECTWFKLNAEFILSKLSFFPSILWMT